jgi:hypothetical protein
MSDVDKFMRRVGDKYPWLHPDYDPDNALWQMRAVKVRDRLRKEASITKEGTTS